MCLEEAVCTSLQILREANDNLSEQQQRELDQIYGQLNEEDQSVLSLTIMTSQIMNRANS
ncbi:MAG: hypothetical protein QXN55_00420 [Candidatus Nitrosotenuis sp.]